jgi:hypothetical protein
MYRYALAMVLSTTACSAADACDVSGTAYDAHGKPMRAVVRLMDLQTKQSTFSITDANAAFAFNGASGGGMYRIDLISEPAKVTGSHIPTRSIVGMSASFSCGQQLAHQDVHAEIE